MKKYDDIIVIGLALIIGGSCFLLLSYDKAPNPEMNEFSTWALGEDWESVETRDVPARWNERHGDLFKLSIDDDLGKGNARMYEAWRKQKVK